MMSAAMLRWLFLLFVVTDFSFHYDCRLAPIGISDAWARQMQHGDDWL
jgi:hypothetical protein